jgi:starch synthase (maltosyl-transferring)
MNDIAPPIRWEPAREDRRSRALPAFLPAQRRFGAKARPIASVVVRVNRARRDHVALRSDHRSAFHAVDCDQLIGHSKTSPDLSDIVLGVVNLDPYHPQHGWVTLPQEALGLPADQPYQVQDLLTDERHLWTGSRNDVRLDPRVIPAHVFAVKRKVGTEQDLDDDP